MKPNADIKLISGNANLPLAEIISSKLFRPLTKARVERFADDEIWVEIQENMRGEDVFIIQSTSKPANDNLMELLVITDALRRASAGRITAVIPYFGYARQDRKPAPRTPITAKLVANLITQAGAERVLTVDLHAGQIQGFFDIPTDNLYAVPVFARHAMSMFEQDDSLMVVSPDVGGLVRARTFAKSINADLAVIDKRRERAGVVDQMQVLGDVDGRTCILFDDIVDSAGTLCKAAEALVEKGAKEVHAMCTHGVLSNSALDRIAASTLKTVSVTDSIDQSQRPPSDKLRVCSIGPMLAEAIGSITRHDSVSRLFHDAPTN
jgi:ribose-phosphate pyrophosphokinase